MKLIATAILIPAAFYLVWSITPSIWSDYQLQNSQKQIAIDYKVTSARCKTYIFVFSSCFIHIQHKYDKNRKNFKYMIFGRGNGQSVFPVLVPKTGEITTNIGLQYITNRISFAILFIILAIAAGCVAIRRMTFL